jgi:hypothetical protein
MLDFYLLGIVILIFLCFFVLLFTIFYPGLTGPPGGKGNPGLPGFPSINFSGQYITFYDQIDFTKNLTLTDFSNKYVYFNSETQDNPLGNTSQSIILDKNWSNGQPFYIDTTNLIYSVNLCTKCDDKSTTCDTGACKNKGDPLYLNSNDKPFRVTLPNGSVYKLYLDLQNRVQIFSSFII